MDDLEEYYRRGEQAFRDSLYQLSGKLLKNVRLQVVAPEINLVVLEFADATFCISEAWNGHGLEISFEGLPTQTLVIQSIYAPDPPEDLNDCLRIAVVSYTYSAGP